MKTYRNHPDAEAELLDAALWYDAQVPGLGSSFHAVVLAALARIGQNPRLFAPRRNGVRKCTLPVFPYSIFYFERAEDIVILAYAHHRRRPNYWRQRLTDTP